MISMNSIRISRASEDDYIIISELGAKTFYETWRPVNTEEDMRVYIKNAFDPEKIRKDIANVSVNTFLIAMNGTLPAGYAKIRRDRTYPEFKDARAIELERIYVEQSVQGKYIGRALMDECIRLANEEKYDWFWLGVNIDNVKAIAFYKKYGFSIFGEKAFQLGAAVDNDYLMKLKLPYFALQNDF